MQGQPGRWCQGQEIVNHIHIPPGPTNITCTFSSPHLTLLYLRQPSSKFRDKFYSQQISYENPLAVAFTAILRLKFPTADIYTPPAENGRKSHLDNNRDLCYARFAGHLFKNFGPRSCVWAVEYTLTNQHPHPLHQHTPLLIPPRPRVIMLPSDNSYYVA